MIALLLAAFFTNTERVAAVAIGGGAIWTATSGGVEQYDLPSGSRLRVFTTADGLDSNDVLQATWQDGALHIRTGRSTCALTPALAFACAPAPPLPPPAPAVAQLFRGARETGRILDGGRQIVATDGAGLWLDGRRLTPEGQLCANHVEALASFRGAIWVGTFDAGVCVLEGDRFRRVAAPFRMVNDLFPAPEGLFIAATEGLYFTRDGRTFRREAAVRDRGANRIAASRRWLFVTTPAALYAIRREGTPRVRRWARPAGSTALQAVAVSGRDVWLASEDAGVIRLRAGKFRAFDRASGLPSSWAVDVAPASGGGVWVATLRHGAVRLGSDGAVERSGPSAWGLRIYSNDGSFLFATQHGIEGWAAPLPDPRVHALLRNRDGFWIGTEGGLALLNGVAKPPFGGRD